MSGMMTAARYTRGRSSTNVLWRSCGCLGEGRADRRPEAGLRCIRRRCSPATDELREIYATAAAPLSRCPGWRQGGRLWMRLASIRCIGAPRLSVPGLSAAHSSPS